MKYLLEYGLYLGLLIATVWLTSKILGITPAKHKYAALDGLRGICAALVAVFHLYWRAGGESDVYWSLDYITISHIKNPFILRVNYRLVYSLCFQRFCSLKKRWHLTSMLRILPYPDL